MKQYYILVLSFIAYGMIGMELQDYSHHTLYNENNFICTSDIASQMIAASENAVKRALAKTCTTLRRLSNKNNDLIYMHNPLVLSKEEKWYGLMYSIYRNNTEAVKNLLKNGAIKNNYIANEIYTFFPCPQLLPLTLAEYKNNHIIIKAIEQEYDKKNQTMSPLYLLAAWFGDINLWNECIQNKTMNLFYQDFNSKDGRGGGSLLHMATRGGHELIVQKLLENQYVQKGINAKSPGGAPALYIAAQRGYYAITEKLLKVSGIEVNGIYENKRGDSMISYTTLYIAVDKKHYDIVELLLQQPGINVNLSIKETVSKNSRYEDNRVKEGYAPLHIATENGDIKMIKLLLTAQDININILGKKEKPDSKLDRYLLITPLDVAYKLTEDNNKEEIISFLINNGAKKGSDILKKDETIAI